MVFSEKFIVIGDIHGCPGALNEVLVQAESYPDHTLLFLGDYIDRGPDVDGVISRLRELKNAIFLYGNHEWWLVQSIEKISNAKLKNFELQEKGISEKNYKWLKNNLIFYYETENYIFTHSGLNPNKKWREQEEDFVFSYCDTDFREITSKIVIQGHIHVPEVVIGEKKILVDTGCALGGHLSGLILPEMIILKSNKTENYMRKYVEDLVRYFKKRLA